MLSEQSKKIALPSGRSIACRSRADECDEVTFRGAGGEVLLQVTLTPEGPLLRFQAAAVEMDCKGSFQVRCEDFKVEARGDATIQANDDVKLNGERVKLNC
jgi:hypothetical protein